MLSVGLKKPSLLTVLHSSFLNSSKAISPSFPNESVSPSINILNGSDFVERSAINWPTKMINPRKLLTSSLVSGFLKLLIAVTFSYEGDIPSALTLYPIISKLDSPKVHLSLLSVALFLF